MEPPNSPSPAERPRGRLRGADARGLVPLGPRDEQVLALLAEHRAIGVDQVAAWLGCAPSTARRRLKRLAGADAAGRRSPRIGYVTWWETRIGEPPVCTIADQGLAALGRRGPAAELKLDEVRHDIGLGWLYIAAHECAFGPLATIVGERAMRAHDRPFARDREIDEILSESRPYGVGANLADERSRRHYPDLMLETESGFRIAVELELTRKSSERLAKVMEAYAIDPNVDAVLYVVPPGPLAGIVRDAADAAAIGDRVHVEVMLPSAGAPDGGGRAPARRHATPARSAQAPVRGDQAPARGGRAPVRGARAPARGGQARSERTARGRRPPDQGAGR